MPLPERFACDADAGFCGEDACDLAVGEAGGAVSLPVDPEGDVDVERFAGLLSRCGSDFHVVKASCNFQIMQAATDWRVRFCRDRDLGNDLRCTLAD